MTSLSNEDIMKSYKYDRRTDMKRMLERYTEKNYDFIVVGGGMAGVCAAMEAARGGWL